MDMVQVLNFKESLKYQEKVVLHDNSLRFRESSEVSRKDVEIALVS